MVDTVRYQGTLEKQCRLKTWSWKKYWFVLQDNQLCYFKDDKQLSASQGMINLSHAITIRECKCGGRLYPLEIATKSKTHILAAVTKDLQRKWLAMLQAAMSLRTKSSRSRGDSTASCNSISDEEESDIHGDDVFLYEEISGDGTKAQCKRDEQINRPQLRPSYSVVRDAISVAESDVGYSEVVSEGRQPKIMKQVLAEAAKNGIYCDVEKDDDLKRLGMPSPTTAKRMLEHSSRLADVSPGEEEEEGLEAEETAAPPLPPRPITYIPHALSPPTTSDETCMNSNTTTYHTSAATAPLSFSPVPNLPHPRLEMDWNSAFNQIRNFIAKNRGPVELYESSKNTQGNGEGIEALKLFLSQLC